jgi:hypothetical protein
MPGRVCKARQHASLLASCLQLHARLNAGNTSMISTLERRQYGLVFCPHWDRGLTAAGVRSHHTLPLLRESTELRLAARIDGGMTMSVRLSAAAFVATVVLAVCSPLYICPQGQLLPSTAHAESKLRTAQAQPAQKSPAAQARWRWKLSSRVCAAARCPRES